MTVQLLILKVRAAAARSASGGSTRPPAGSKHSHQNKLLVVSDVAFQERLFPRSNELLLCATHGCCLFSVLSHSVSLAFVFYAVYLQAQKPLWRLNFSVGLILAEACKAFIEDKVSFWRKMPLREPNCTEYVTQTHCITCVLAAKEATCTLPTSWHCTKSLRPLSFSSGSCSCSRMTTVFMWMSFKEPFPFQQAVLISWCLPRFLGKEGGLGQHLPPVGWPPLHERPACPWLCPGALLNTCGQDHSLKHSREIIQLLKNLGARTSHQVLPPPHITTCTKYVHREQFYSSFSFMLWTFVCRCPSDHLFWLSVHGHHLAVCGVHAAGPVCSPSAGMAWGHQQPWGALLGDALQDPRWAWFLPLVFSVNTGICAWFTHRQSWRGTSYESMQR